MFLTGSRDLPSQKISCEVDSMENLTSDLSDATIELDDVDDPCPELFWSDDSHGETEICAHVKPENFIHRNVWPILGAWGVQWFTFWGHQAGPMQRIICVT